MAKVNLPRLSAGGFGSVTLINQALAEIEAAFENTVSRDGDLPNQLQFDLDLNGFNILNSGNSDDPNRLVEYQELVDYVQGAAAGLVVQRIQNITATSGQTVFTLTDFEYQTGSNNLAVYREGVRQVKDVDYVETSASVVTFLAGVTINDVVSFVNNEFVGTVDLPTHTHTWAQVTGKPDTATRWPTWDEVTGKPPTFTPSGHGHDAGDITILCRWGREQKHCRRPRPSTPRLRRSVSEMRPCHLGG